MKGNITQRTSDLLPVFITALSLTHWAAVYLDIQSDSSGTRNIIHAKRTHGA